MKPNVWREVQGSICQNFHQKDSFVFNPSFSISFMSFKNIVIACILLISLLGCTSSPQTTDNTGNTKLATGNLSWPPADLANPQNIIDFQLTAIKNITGSYDNISFIVTFNSTRSIQNTTVQVHGFLSSYDAEYLKENRTVDVVTGHNRIVFNYTMPECSRCSGLSPADYAVFSEIVQYNETLANDSIVVSVR
jgi:hypothetical protein